MSRFATSAKYDPNQFNGMDDECIAKAYETFFNGILYSWRGQSSDVRSGHRNLFSSKCGQIVFVGPKAVEVTNAKQTKKDSRTNQSCVAYLHPVLKSKTYKKMIRRHEVRQIFWQVLLPGHTCFLVFEDGVARLVDSDTKNFGWTPDIVAALKKVIPWNQIWTVGLRKTIHTFTYYFKPGIPNSCAIITMCAIKHLIQEKHWESGIIKLAIVEVVRSNVTKRFSCNINKTSRKKQQFNVLIRQQKFEEMIKECFNWVVKNNVIGPDEFLPRKPKTRTLSASML